MKKLIYFLIPLLFIPKVNALTQCGSQGIEYDNKTMPLIVFLGNSASSGYEIQNYAFSDSTQSALNWSFNSYQQLCAKGSGSLSGNFSYITFRIVNYTFLKGNIYSVVFSFTDTNQAWNIDATSVANQNMSWARIITSKADPRDKIMYLTVVFEATENYSGTSNFVYYIDSTNLSDFARLTDHFYTPYITSVPSVTDNTAQLNNIRNLQQNTLNAVQSVQGQVTQVQTELNNIDDTLNDDTIDDTNTTSTLEDLADDLPTNSVISDLLLLPVRLFQSVLSGINGTCSPFALGSLYGTNLTMPCINIQNYLGSSIWTFIDIVISGMFVLVIRKKFVDIFHNLTDLRNGGNDLE